MPITHSEHVAQIIYENTYHTIAGSMKNMASKPPMPNCRHANPAKLWTMPLTREPYSWRRQEMHIRAMAAHFDNNQGARTSLHPTEWHNGQKKGRTPNLPHLKNMKFKLTWRTSSWVNQKKGCLKRKTIVKHKERKLWQWKMICLIQVIMYNKCWQRSCNRLIHCSSQGRQSTPGSNFE